MSYYVHKTYNNGNYCGCCSRHWYNTEEYDTLTEALIDVSRISETFERDNRADSVLESITVKDTTSGEEVASWSLSSIDRKGNKYYWHVYGYLPDTPFQSVVYSGSERTTLTSEEAWAIVEKEHLERELRDKQQKLEEAQKNFNWAKQQLEKNEEVK
jgi:hypothetical protein